jgi:uncharacterized phage protein (TIGR01671 family)
MNREIKFRVWDNSKKSWITEWNDFVPLWRLESLKERKIHVLSGNGECAGYTIQQFTGLKDKNSKEIYEGDIVTFKQPEFKQIQQKEKIFIETVIFNKDNVSFELTDISPFHISYMDMYEIIGNIFENSELLK